MIWIVTALQEPLKKLKVFAGREEAPSYSEELRAMGYTPVFGTP